jgi:hypothetical protein
MQAEVARLAIEEPLVGGIGFPRQLIYLSIRRRDRRG